MSDTYNAASRPGRDSGQHDDQAIALGTWYLTGGGTGAQAWIRWARAKAIEAGAIVDDGDQDQPEPRPKLAPAAAVPALAPELEGIVVDAVTARKLARDAAMRAHPDMTWYRSA